MASCYNRHRRSGLEALRYDPTSLFIGPVAPTSPATRRLRYPCHQKCPSSLSGHLHSHQLLNLTRRPSSDEYDNSRLFERCSPLLRSEHHAMVRDTVASPQGNFGPRLRPAVPGRYRFGHRKQFRLRDARSDGAGCRPVGRRQRCLQSAAVEDEVRGNPCRARDACDFGGDTQSMPTAHGVSDAHRRR